MIYKIEVVKEIVHDAEIEGNTLREALQKIEDEYVDWDVPQNQDDEGPTAIIGVSHEGSTYQQDKQLIKEAKKIWNEISK
jgi:hypothetical protein